MNGTLTDSEAKKFERAPRLPPGSWEETAALLTMYSLFLKMLFGLKSEYLRGVDEVRRTLMSMAEIKSKLKPSYYANIIWAVLDNTVKHFNECMSIEDFTGSQFGLV